MSRKGGRWGDGFPKDFSPERFLLKRREKLEKRRRQRTGLRARLTRMFALVAVLAVALSSVLTVGSIFRALSRAEISIGSVQLGTVQSGAVQTGTGQTGSAAPSGTATVSPESSAATWRARFADPTFRAAGTALGGEIIRSAANAALLSAILAAVVAGIVTRQITRPLVRLTEGAQRLEAGERGVQVQVPPRADELQTLTLTFNALTTRLARQEAWRRGLMADIAHDLRTPLSVLRSEIEAMQDGLSSPDEAGLSRLHGEVLLLARLVSDLRTLSLAESGALSLHPVRLDVAGTLGSAAAAHAGRAAAAGTEVILDAPRPLFIQADADRLTQIFNNLIDNALRYAAPTPPGRSRLELSAVQEDGRAVLRIRDHGPGFQPGDLSRAFERFYRADASRTRHPQHGQSSGLGLAIARALVEAQGGQIEARNHPQGGAEFMLSFPLV